MTTRDMTAEEHVDTSSIFLEQADQEFEAGDILPGDILKASEKHWGAASHAIMAVAMRRGWPVWSHRNLVDAVNLLATERNDESLRAGFALARKFHSKFYGHGRFDPFGGDGDLEMDRSIVANHVRRMLDVAAESDW